MKKPIKLKKQTAPNPTAPKPAPPGASHLQWFILCGCMILAAVATWAVFEFVVWNALPSSLVGKWVVVGGPQDAQDGATFDFYRSGAMVGNVNVKGANATVEATVRVEDQKLYSTTINPNTNRPETRVQRIVVHTATDLVLEDERGQRLVMERAN
jgi:hypothetical protein